MSESLRRDEVRGTSYLTGGEGEPVVFLHGVPGSTLTWKAVATQLQDHYHVIVPDLRGFGHSDPPTGDYYMESQARALNELLDTLDVDTFSLVTHDFGGPVALTTMRLFPELDVKGLVLSDTNVFTDTYVPPPLRIATIPALNSIFFRLIVGNRFGMRMLYRRAVTRTETLTWSAFQRHLTPSGIALTRRIFQRSLADLETNYGDIERMLPTIRLPTLILWGDSDPFFSTEVGERARTTITDAKLIIYPRTGHFVPEERPTDVASDVLAFFENRTN